MAAMIRVLVVDSSAVACRQLTRGLSADPAIRVIGAARTPFEARDLIVELAPDVLTLEVAFPQMDGIEFLRRLMPQRPVPTIMVSSRTRRGSAVARRALDAGAFDVVAKPAGTDRGISSIMAELRAKVRLASNVDPPTWLGWRPSVPVKGAGSSGKIIAIGASTGGTEALRSLLRQFPADAPGTVVVQHLPRDFTSGFARHLDALAAMEVTEARSGDRVVPGRVLVAPGDRHMQVVHTEHGYRVRLSGTAKVNRHRPSVCVLMHSVAKAAGAHGVGAILTGMGRDGASGLLAMRLAGGRTIAQDEASSVVFGMPKAAWEIGGAELLRPIDTMAQTMLKLVAGTT